MKITLAMVMSVDGKTTRGNESEIYTWTSREDQIHFSALINRCTVIIMGKKTFEASQVMIMRRLTPKTLRLVVTNNPEQYVDLAVPGQLEFTNNLPIDIISLLKSRGYTKSLLIGGHQLFASFLDKQLIDELILTIEPMIFGSGKPLIFEKSLYDIELKLMSHKKINTQGTLLLHYKVNNKNEQN